MNNSLWKEVGILPKIKQIEAKSLVDAITLAYASNGYYFQNSSWFIDIKNRFRIFNLNNSILIVKRVDNNRVDLEIERSEMAHKLLHNQKIGSKIINIYIPKKVVTKNGDSFLVSEYLGSDINDNIYTKISLKISMVECLDIIRLFIKNGISYRGFLPRNIIQKKNTLFLFDWEDSSFGNPPVSSTFDHLWKTNFLLNWSYLFGFTELKDGLNEIIVNDKLLSEPDLVKYERSFSKIIGHKSSIRLLRDKIDKVVFGAELPVIEESDNFYLRPNDMGHVVADIFSSEIDVLYDILAYMFRQNNKSLFYWHICLITHTIVLYYRSILIEKDFLSLSLRYYVLVTILMMIDHSLNKDTYIKLLSTETLDKLMEEILYESQNQSITRLFLSEKTDNFYSLLKLKFRNSLSINLPDIKIKNSDTVLKEVFYIFKEHKNKRK